MSTFNVQITKAHIITLAYLEEQYPAYASLLAAVFSGEKVLFDLRVKITDSEGHFLQGVTSNNVQVTTLDEPITINSRPAETVKATTVVANPPHDYHVQAFAKPAPAADVHVEKGGESAGAVFQNIPVKKS
jgi:hypothetical protein